MDPQAFEERVAAAFAAADALAGTQQRARSGIFDVQVRASNEGIAREFLQAMLPPRAGGEALPILLAGAELDLHALAPRPATRGKMHDGTRYWLLWTGGEQPVLQAWDRVERRGLVWLAQGAAPSWELSRPACALINQATAPGPCTLVHGAAVGLAGRTLLLVAPGRAGKTSAALACAANGWDYAGDDYVMVDSSSAEVLPLYASARLRADMAARFQGLLAQSTRAISEDGGETRHELDLARALDPAQLRGGHIAAVLVPRRRGAARVEFAPAQRSDAFNAMFTSSVQGAPGPLAGHAPKLSSLLARAPVHFVDTGPDPAAIPDAFARFLDAL